MIPYHPTPKFSVRPNNFRLVPDHPLADDLRGLWGGSLGGGRFFADSSVNNKHGNAVQTTPVDWSYGIQRRILTLNGNPQYVSLPDTEVLKPSTALTIAGWVRVSDVLNHRDQPLLIRRWASTNPWFSYVLKISGSDSFTRPSTSINVNTTIFTANAVTELTANVWYHLAMTWESGAPVRIFIDGIEEGNSGQNHSGSISYTADRPINIGYDEYDNRWLSARFTDVLLSGRAWPSDEIGQIADPTNVMLSGAIEPIPTQTYFLPLAAPQPTQTVFIPYHHQPKYSVRPNNFRLVPDHPLWDGCELAGLGSLSGSGIYRDQTRFNNDGILTAFTDIPGAWIRYPGAPCVGITLAATTEYVALSDPDLGGNIDWSMSFWLVTTNTSNYVILQFYNPNPNYEGVGIRMQGSDLEVWSNTVGAWTSILLNVNDGVLRHITIRHTNSTNTVEAFVNGQLDNTIGSFTNGDPYAGVKALGHSTSNLDIFDFLGDVVLHKRTVADNEIAILSNPVDPMLSGAIEPYPTQTYFVPISAPTPSILVTDIFQSAIIGD